MVVHAEYPESLVLRVNEVYHDVEGRRYEEIHPEIFEDERIRWDRFGRTLDMDRSGVTLLDVGTGTGFVPMTIGRYLRGGDHLVCADVSGEMLDISRDNLSDAGLACTVDYVKLDGRGLPADGTFDYVLMNSVLHHVPDIAGFLNEVDRVTKRDGYFVVAHEPNRAFYTSRMLMCNYRVARCVVAPGQAVGAALRALGLMEPARKVRAAVSRNGREANAILSEVNETLMSEGAIEKPLTSSEMTAIVDIHSPTAGGFHRERGIDVPAIVRSMDNFELVELDTYNYVGNLTSRNRMTRALDAWLQKRHSGRGATIFAVLRKVRSE